MPDEDELLRVGLVAMILGVNPKTVDVWGKGEARLLGEPVVVGKQVRYRRSAVLAFKARREAEAAAADEIKRQAADQALKIGASQ